MAWRQHEGGIEGKHRGESEKKKAFAKSGVSKNDIENSRNKENYAGNHCIHTLCLQHLLYLWAASNKYQKNK